MERKYDYHNSGYPIYIKTEWEPKDTKEVSVNKEEKIYSEDSDEKYEYIEHWKIMGCYDYKIDNKTIDSSNWEIISEYKITVDKHFKKRDNLNERDVQEIYSRELIIYNENTN